MVKEAWKKFKYSSLGEYQFLKQGISITGFNELFIRVNGITDQSSFHFSLLFSMLH